MVPVHNIKAVSDNTYYFIGKMIATCVIQGGEVPACFTQAVADYLVHDRVASLDDIADYEIRQSLSKVTIASNNITLAVLLLCIDPVCYNH